MKRMGMAIALFLMFTLLAAVTTAVTYAMVFGVIWFIGFSFRLPNRYSWVPLVGTCAVFVIGLVTAIRNRIPDIAGLKWDSGTPEGCPSKVDVWGGGGRMWNVNPLGAQSVSSIAAIGGAILCAGPSLAISAFVTAIEELRKDRQQQPDA